MTRQLSRSTRRLVRTLFIGSLTMAWVAAVPVPGFAQETDDSDAASLRKQVSDLETQVTKLNQRVATLERLLLTQIIETSPENTRHLQLAVEVAEDALTHSETLLGKGYVSEFQVQADRYALERAQLRLELASMAADTAEFAASIQLFEAQARLDLAIQRLENSQRLASRGYVTQAQIRADELDVERARAQVQLIKAKLLQASPESDDDKVEDIDEDKNENEETTASTSSERTSNDSDDKR